MHEADGKPSTPGVMPASDAAPHQPRFSPGVVRRPSVPPKTRKRLAAALDDEGRAAVLHAVGMVRRLAPEPPQAAKPKPAPRPAQAKPRAVDQQSIAQADAMCRRPRPGRSARATRDELIVALARAHAALLQAAGDWAGIPGETRFKLLRAADRAARAVACGMTDPRASRPVGTMT